MDLWITGRVPHPTPLWTLQCTTWNDHCAFRWPVFEKTWEEFRQNGLSECQTHLRSLHHDDMGICIIKVNAVSMFCLCSLLACSWRRVTVYLKTDSRPAVHANQTAAGFAAVTHRIKVVVRLNFRVLVNRQRSQPSVEECESPSLVTDFGQTKVGTVEVRQEKQRIFK